MKSFAWDSSWNCIVFRFVAGYQAEADLIAVLQKAKRCLAASSDQAQTRGTQESYIILQDKLRRREIDPAEEDGQKVRYQREFEAVFEAAGLRVNGPPSILEMKNGILPIITFVLY